MEAINDSARLIANSVELIKKFINRPKYLNENGSEQELTELFDSVELLQSALEKLIDKI